MSSTRKIPADHGLEVRMFITGLLLVILMGAVGTGIWFAFKSLVIVVVVVLGLLAAQYWFSDRLALWGMHGRIVTPQEAPVLHGVVDRLCALATMPKPRVAIADTDMPNAFATGRNPKASVICATSGLMRRLDEPELEAVLAHELSHVAHRDVAIMTIASSLGVLAGLVTRIMLFSTLLGGGGRGRMGGNNRGGTQIILIEMLALLASIVVYAISFLLTRALSRYRELAADRSGAILIGRPSLLASALVKISGEMARIPTRDLRRAEPFNAFFFAPAIATPGPTGRGGSGLSLGNLFSTHPTLEKRLAQLSELESQMGHAH